MEILKRKIVAEIEEANNNLSEIEYLEFLEFVEEEAAARIESLKLDDSHDREVTDDD